MQTEVSHQADYPQYSSPSNPYPPPQGYSSGIGQPGYYPQQNSFQNDVPVVQSNTGILAPQKQFPYQANGLSYATEINCPKCKKRNMTVIENEFGAGTYTMAYILFLLTGIFCCWVPFCMNDCKDKVHRCSQCHEEVGIKPYNIC